MQHASCLVMAVLLAGAPAFGTTTQHNRGEAGVSNQSVADDAASGGGGGTLSPLAKRASQQLTALGQGRLAASAPAQVRPASPGLDPGAAYNQIGKGAPQEFDRAKKLDTVSTNIADTCPLKATVIQINGQTALKWPNGATEVGNFSNGSESEEAKFLNREHPELNLRALHPNQDIRKFNVTGRVLSLAQIGATRATYYAVEPKDFNKGLEQRSNQLWMCGNCLCGGGEAPGGGDNGKGNGNGSAGI